MICDSHCHLKHGNRDYSGDCRRRRTTAVDDIVEQLTRIAAIAPNYCEPLMFEAATGFDWRDALIEIAKELIARLDGSEGRFDLNGDPMALASRHSHEIMLMRVALGLPIDDDYRRAYATRFGDRLAAVPPASPAPQSDALAEIENLVEATLTRGDLQYGLGQIADVARRARRGE